MIIVARHRFSLLLYLCAVLVIGICAARKGASDFYSSRAIHLGSETIALTATSLDTGNPNAYEALGTLSIKNQNYLRACEAFSRASEIRPNDFTIWERLGFCYRNSGNVDAAEMAYQKSIALAPHYSRPRYDIGMMYYHSRRYQEAFRYLSEAAQRDLDLLPGVLEMASNAFPGDPVSIEKSVRISSYEGRKAIALYFIRRNDITQDLRDFLMGEEITEKDKDELVFELFKNRRYSLAREMWISKMKADGDGSSALVFDGGFERFGRNDDSPFGWKYEIRPGTVSVSINQNKFHSGKNCVRINFTGDADFGRNVISQLTLLTPKRKYRLSFFVRSSEVISAGLPAVVVADGISDQVIARSEFLRSTDDRWIELRLEFLASESGLVLIGLQRPGCTLNPCPIFGELMLDEFSVIEAP